MIAVRMAWRVQDSWAYGVAGTRYLSVWRRGYHICRRMAEEEQDRGASGVGGKK